MSKNIVKTLWFSLLFVDIIIFEQAIIHSNFFFLILAAVIATIVNFKGNESMFGEYNRKREEKIEARKKRLEIRRKLKRK